MKKAKILTHFSETQWPLVNQIIAISRAFDIEHVHCSTWESLSQTLLECQSHERSLLFSDEGMLEELNQIEPKIKDRNIEVALFVESIIPDVANQISHLSLIKYVIGINKSTHIGRDLSVLVKKFLNNDHLDLEKYLTFGSSIKSFTIRSSKDKNELIERVYQYVMNLGPSSFSHLFDEYGRRISEMVDELVLNAIFNANPRLKSANRGELFVLSEGEEILVKYGFDGEYFGVAVRDPFGTFDRETILNYLASKQDVGTILSNESGGLGLKIIFERSHQMIANIKEKNVTELISLVRFENRISDYERRKRSFFYFSGT